MRKGPLLEQEPRAPQKRSMKSIHSIQPESIKLADFDLTPEAVRKIIEDAHRAAADIDEYCPANARGLTFYFHVVGGLRRFLLKATPNWKKKVVNGLEFVENKLKGIRIGYVSGDEGTGASNSTLKSRVRGASSFDVVAVNSQLRLAFPASYFESSSRKGEDFESWFLVVCREAMGYQIELALPVTMDGKRFVGWERRIVLGEVSLNSEPKLDEGITPSQSAKPKVRRRWQAGAGTQQSVGNSESK